MKYSKKYFYLILIFIVFFANCKIKTKKDVITNRKKSLLLITIDTWRWDYIGVSGMNKVETPNLDFFAKNGLYIKEAITPCPLTTPAHASILTGEYPLKHRIFDCTNYKLDPKIYTMPEFFKKLNYETAAFVSSQTLNKEYGLVKGFSKYDDEFLNFQEVDEIGNGAFRDGADTLKKVLKYLEGNSSIKNIFLWIHFYDPHKPYIYHTFHSDKYSDDPYAAQVSYVDELIGKLYSYIKNEKEREWKIVIVGDHGEGLGDKNEPYHGMGIYRSTLSVPLIIYPFIHKFKDDSLILSLTDIFPLTIKLMGFSNDKQDIISFLENKKKNEIYALTILPSLMFGVNPIFGLKTENFLYIKHSTDELYDIKKDPDENENLSSNPDYKNVLKDMKNKCGEYFDFKKIVSIIEPTLIPSEKDELNLKNLGYLEGSSAPKRILQKAELNQILEDWSILNKIRENNSYGASEKERILRNLYLKYPYSSTLAKDLSILLSKLGRLDESIYILEMVLKHNPKDFGILSNLGTLYSIKGRGIEAERMFLKALNLRKNNPNIHKNLGILYANVLNMPETQLHTFFE